MALLKKAATVAVLATAGVVGTVGMAAADCCGHPAPAREQGDDHLRQEGLVVVNALNNLNVSPNLGCSLDRTLPNLTAQSLLGAIPVGVALDHLLEHADVNVLANGNVSTEVNDNSCTSNQGSSQAGNNSHGSTGAGSSSSVHNGTGAGAGSHNSENGKGAGGLLGGTGILGTGL
jgi:hypothetical protein